MYATVVSNRKRKICLWFLFTFLKCKFGLIPQTCKCNSLKMQFIDAKEIHKKMLYTYWKFLFSALVRKTRKHSCFEVSKRQVTQEVRAVKQFSAMPIHSLNISWNWNSNCLRNSTLNLISEMILPLRSWYAACEAFSSKAAISQTWRQSQGQVFGKW